MERQGGLQGTPGGVGIPGGAGTSPVTAVNRGMPEERWRARPPEISHAIFERIVALGGTISGEHGIGYIQRSNLPLALSGETIALSRRLKRAFDPAMILNPGKVFDG